MRTTKRTSRTKAGVGRAVKVAGLALVLLAGAPASGGFVPGGEEAELAAQRGVRGTRKVVDMFWFDICWGSCPGVGAECCGKAVL